MTEFVEQLHTAAGAVNHADDRQLVFPGVAIGIDPLLGDRRFRRTTPDGEIIGRHHSAPPVDLTDAHHGRARCGRGDRALRRVLHRAGKNAELLETFIIEQMADALTRREFALGVVFFHRFGTTQCVGDFPTRADVRKLQRPFRGNRRAHDDFLCRRAR
ncbi:hypothetical protein D3C72_1534560 [compost metagenome]